MSDSITIRLPDMLGDTIIATKLLQALHNALPSTSLYVHSKYPELLAGMPYLNVTYVCPIWVTDNYTHYHIDLRDYDGFDPDTGTYHAFSKPYRHLSHRMLDITTSSLIKRGFPDIVLDADVTYLLPNMMEEQERFRRFVQREVLNLPENLARRANFYAAQCVEHWTDNGVKTWRKTDIEPPTCSVPFVVWTQERTSKLEKNWPDAHWETVKQHFRTSAIFIDLSVAKYGDRRFTPLEAIAATQICDAGIALDSFLLHGAHAAGAKNVIAILPISPPEVVAYPESQIVLNGTSENIVPERVICELETIFAAL